MGDDKRDVFKIPHDVLAEQAVLAAAMSSKDARVTLVSRVRPELFQDADHSIAWGAILSLVAQGHEPTPTAISKFTGARVDQKYLIDIVAANPATPKDLTFLIEALSWDRVRAQAVQGPIAELLRALQDPGTSQERVRALARQVPVSFHGSSTRVHIVDGTRLVAEHSQTLRRRMQGIGLYPTGIEGIDCYPLNSIDDDGKDVSGQPMLIPGLEPGKVTTISAISGGGKSTFCALLALNQARMLAEKNAGGKILYGAWEMSPNDVLELMACISAQIPRNRVRIGAITDAEHALIKSRMEAIRQWVTFVQMPFNRSQGTRHSHDEVLDVIHGYIADTGASIAIFDLWRRAFRRMKDEADEAEALFRMQTIADETKCHVILVQQQRLKDIETRVNPAPTREGIKGSSAWVDASDTIFGIYLPGLMKRVSRNIIQIHILKQRFGRWPLVVEYVYDGDLVRLTEPRLVWDIAYGDEVAAQSGGRSAKPIGEAKDLQRMMKKPSKKAAKK